MDYIIATPDDVTGCECPMCRRPVKESQLVSCTVSGVNCRIEDFQFQLLFQLYGRKFLELLVC